MSPKNPGRKMKHECYRRMARLASEFVDANCLGIYIPESGHMRPHDEHVIDALRSNRPLWDSRNGDGIAVRRVGPTELRMTDVW